MPLAQLNGVLTTNESFDLGLRLRTLRLNKGFTLRGLARRAGCSASFLSQIELNQGSPTVANLQKICRALQFPVSDVLREEVRLQEPQMVRISSESNPIAMRWHKAQLRYVLAQSIPAQFTMLVLKLEPGAEIPERSANRSINELAVVLNGEVELRVGGQAFRLAGQQGLYFNLSSSHQWKNVGTAMAEILMVNSHAFHLFEQEEEDAAWTRRRRRHVAA
jgi:transcriptional regulator with XRE-family HTH domain